MDAASIASVDSSFATLWMEMVVVRVQVVLAVWNGKRGRSDGLIKREKSRPKPTINAKDRHPQISFCTLKLSEKYM